MTGAFHHLTGHFLTYCRLLLNNLMINVQQFFLDFISIRHDATLEIVGGTGCGDDGLGNTTASTTLSSTHALSFLVEQSTDFTTEDSVF